jgi:hypothetical protein
LWILGLKTEVATTAIVNDGGNVEILGGLHLPGTLASVPLMTNINGGRISAAYVTEILAGSTGYTDEMTSTIGGISNTVLASSLPSRGAYNGNNVPQFTTDLFVPSIQWASPPVSPSASIGTAVSTATLGGYNYTGTPVYSLTSNPGGKYAINSSTGAVTVAAALTAGTDSITIAVGGSLTFGATGTPTITPVAVNINVATPATLDASKKSAAVTLSGGSLIATATATNSNGQMALSTTSHSSGRFFFEVTQNVYGGTVTSNSFGFANASQSYASSNFLGTTGSNSVGVFDNGHTYLNNTNVHNGPTFETSGDIIGVDVNITARTFRYQVNGGSFTSDIDISAVAGALFAGVEVDKIANQQTINFGPTFSYTMPSGAGY